MQLSARKRARDAASAAKRLSRPNHHRLRPLILADMRWHLLSSAPGPTTVEKSRLACSSSLARNLRASKPDARHPQWCAMRSVSSRLDRLPLHDMKPVAFLRSNTANGIKYRTRRRLRQHPWLGTTARYRCAVGGDWRRPTPVSSTRAER